MKQQTTTAVETTVDDQVNETLTEGSEIDPSATGEGPEPGLQEPAPENN